MNAHVQVEAPFELVQAVDGTWEIHDRGTGRPVEIGNRQATGMRRDDAEELMQVLAAAEGRRRPASASRFPTARL